MFSNPFTVGEEVFFYVIISAILKREVVTQNMSRTQ